MNAVLENDLHTAAKLQAMKKNIVVAEDDTTFEPRWNAVYQLLDDAAKAFKEESIVDVSDYLYLPGIMQDYEPQEGYDCVSLGFNTDGADIIYTYYGDFSSNYKYEAGSLDFPDSIQRKETAENVVYSLLYLQQEIEGALRKVVFTIPKQSKEF